MKPLPPAPAKPSLLSPGSLLAILVLAGWMLCMLWPRLLELFGIGNYGPWYLDSYAVLAAVDALRAGLDPTAPNPLDALGRDHKYSDWWFALRWLAVTRESNFLVGTSWVGAFGLAAWRTMRPRNFRETGWFALLLLSPPVLLAVYRANNDLVIFTLLAVCGVAAAGTTWVRRILALAALVLATGLKFYPAVAAGAFLWTKPVRRMPAMFLGASLAVALTLASVWPQLSRGQFSLPSTLHTMGAPLLWRDLGWAGPGSFWLGLVLIVTMAVLFVVGRFTTGLATEGSPPGRLLAALGTIVLVACFAAGINYAYRWIFGLWMAQWLWQQASVPAPRRRNWTVRLGCVLVFLCIWSDGLLALTVNLLFPPLSPAGRQELQLVWRLCTQPLHWLLMMLLAGWLLDAAIAIGKEWAADRATA
ncbi:MAG TPA: hypothetical protein VL200_08570 [Lacunisphaera sp.]|jgi:hypothetical protein|nr:hypothetical protein [Lacunisphaera sp.]